MYWCKIATTEKEFDDIAALNYETFIEEIPQYKPNDTRRKVDRFHSENQYIVVYKETEIVGMLAFRDNRPFSLDEKIGKVEQYLDESDCGKLAEIRLLAVKKTNRTGRVLFRLIQAVYAFAYHQGYSAAVISGTTREQKLYKQMGFEAFAPAVGSEEAKFVPMILTRSKFEQELEKRISKGNQYTFYPGPVKQNSTLSHTNLSHRSDEFNNLFSSMKKQLLELSGANYIATVVGSGTLANDVMLGQLKVSSKKKGLILVNGEFGERLADQANNWGLNFEMLASDWGMAHNLSDLNLHLKSEAYEWVLMVHGETSTGTLNSIEPILEITKRYNVKLCVDCISSFGALPFSMSELHLATSVSGKAIGAVSGLAFIFSEQLVEEGKMPSYLNLAKYQKSKPPFTIPAMLVANVLEALKNYPNRYRLLEQRFMKIRDLKIVEKYGVNTNHYPMIITLQLSDELIGIIEDLKLNGIHLHGDSAYLRNRNFVQLSTIQPDFEEAFTQLKWIEGYYISVIEKAKLIL
ncbi:aminotransferase class V-fold PLP-dependent enzyme [Ureibacillus chungkukjangi]|uniref:aminotransferase class V-fold PLP-dependent enzyme n=1 Tax=Ureibacillus chungkukjangi TaxID=1202712 RepID=UPI002041A90B|nr:aminotransferase class V-fold PLP-dependent enzyme [Ureibacillus chungkukjangi]MCM3389898.1 aminotransferase class V-fold PLP-dependent enzyme [Ureibacillus chungkukjangi]